MGSVAVSNPSAGTSVQKTVITTAADGTATWRFPTAFLNPPSMAAIAEGDTTSPVSVQITAISPTQATIKVFKQTPQPAALISLTVMTPQSSPGVTSVHLYAAPNPN